MMTRPNAISHPTGWSHSAVELEDANHDEGALATTIRSAQTYLLSIQHSDGHWRGELEGDTLLESEWVLLMLFLGRLDLPQVAKAAEYLRRTQLDTGGWTHYFGGPVEVSVSVKAYFVLKLMGDDPQAPHMVRAREAIIGAGGIEACNSFTKIFLAIFGQFPWRRVPAVPPEMILLPLWAPFHIYRMSSWSRTIVIPLSIVWAHRPRCPVPAHACIDELWAHAHVHAHDPRSPDGGRHWRAMFRALDRGIWTIERLRIRPLRRRALDRAERWILERLQGSDGLGAIFPPIVYTIMALRCLGYPTNHPVVQGQIREIENLEIENDETLRVQPCVSPVWDTALTMDALQASGLPADDPALCKAARWLIAREIRRAGDWSIRRPGVENSGWCFEYRNDFYPDLDDTAQVLKVLMRSRFSDMEEDEQRTRAIERGSRWMVGMQNRDGGWGAFDAECNDTILVHVPFADHNAMIDPSCEDVSARAMETLAMNGRHTSAVRRAEAFLRQRQLPDGTWYGRWGCNYLYGTFLAVRALARVCPDPGASETIARAIRWLRVRQNPDGGWGELPRSYDDPSLKGFGPSTAAQTAWALLTFFAAGDFTSSAVRRGIHHLLVTQRADGSWWDEPWTGTGFPRVFYLRYHLYATYFPLLALGSYHEHNRRPPIAIAEDEGGDER